MGDACFTTQLIDENGDFNVLELENFMKEVKLNDCGISYAVVSIMGLQSSGKSTLLNNLFGTNFAQMDSSRAPKQTTQGIWLGKAQNIEPCTIVMDLEGTDGGERADDTTFERQSALFALVVSDILLINMNKLDIGRQQAACKPLLNAVFQVMMKLFSPRKITLLFVIRDKEEATLEVLEPTLWKDVQKIWDALPKPLDREDVELTDFFNIEVVALSHYVYKEELFKEEVSSLRDRFQHSITPGGLAGGQRIAAASDFSSTTQKLWKVIKEDKDLDLPTLNAMVAMVRCVEISNRKFASFKDDEEWRHFEESVQRDYIKGFGNKISSLLHRYLSEYDREAIYFDENERTSKRQDLESKLLQLITPACKSVMGHLRATTFEAFKDSFDNALENEGFAAAARDRIEYFLDKFDRESEDDTIQQVNWDPKDMMQDLKRDMNAHVMSVRTTKLSGLSDRHKANLARALAEPVKSRLYSPSDNTWGDIRELIVGETKVAVANFKSDLSAFELDEASKAEQVSLLNNHGNRVAESCAREETATVVIRMKERFSVLFHLDASMMPRVWTKAEEIIHISRIADFECMKMILILAEIWLDEDDENIQWNNPGTTVILFDPLTSSSRKRIPRKKTLLSLARCESLWKQFKGETVRIVYPALARVIERIKERARNKRMMILTGLIATKLVLVASGLGVYAVFV